MYKKHYTPISLARILINLIQREKIDSVIDIASGSGNLLKAANEKWDSKFFGYDLLYSLSDKESIKNYPRIICNEKDAFKVNDYEREYGKHEIILLNPPFDGRKYILCKQKFINSLTDKDSFLLEEYFVLLNLSIIDKKSAGLLILPASIINNLSGKWLRKIMLNLLNITHVIEIPIGVFPKVNISTYALIFDNVCEKGVSFGKYLLDKQKLTYTFRNRELSYERFDIPNSISLGANHTVLGQMVISHSRGYTKYNKKNYYYIRKLKGCIPLIHTDNIKNGRIMISKKQYYVKKDSSLYKKQHEISQNDIIVSRVGVGCIGRPAIVLETDVGIVSDCIYLLKLKNKNQSEIVFNYLMTLYNDGYYKNLGRGSNKSVLIVDDLLNIKIPNGIDCIK